MQIKDGVSWTALEYYKWLQGPDGAKARGQKDLVIIPASLVYTEKSRYRSSVVVKYVHSTPSLPTRLLTIWTRFGKAINVADYVQQFLSSEEGAPRTAVKKLTKDIGTELVKMTLNAPDW